MWLELDTEMIQICVRSAKGCIRGDTAEVRVAGILGGTKQYGMIEKSCILSDRGMT